MAKVASNAGEKDGAPAATTSSNPGQSNANPTDQGEVPVVATNCRVRKRRRGVAGDPVQKKTLEVLEKIDKRLDNLEVIEENTKPSSKMMPTLRTVREVVTIANAFLN
jgi:hypothetical protein